MSALRGSRKVEGPKGGSVGAGRNLSRGKPREAARIVCEACGTSQVDTRARRVFERPAQIFAKPCHRRACSGRVFEIQRGAA
jgi:hypothetical protein